LVSAQKTYKPAVAIPAFRRPDAFKKLLHSVNNAVYPDGGCTLILSLEGGVNEEVRNVAEEFEFEHGEKKIITHTEKLGLKSHIYSCADYSKEYGSIIVLEEDLIVSPAYYQFAVRALQAYHREEAVAGISLYAQRFNETAQLPFEPMPSYFAGYFMQLACSWGQAWTADQWGMYQEWISENPVPALFDDLRIPKNIREWPAQSWKKEFNYYLTRTRRTIFYPYHSVTTNSSHYGGENMARTGSLFEVPLLGSCKGAENLIFPEHDNAFISYDMYMEAEGKYVEETTGFKPEEVSLDLYGTKPVNLLTQRKWVISSKHIENSSKGFALQRKPVEGNLNNQVTFGTPAFFSLVQSSRAYEFKNKRWGYIQLAIQMGLNRLSTGRFIIDNFLYNLKNRMDL
jgi:hypothetical protein